MKTGAVAPVVKGFNHKGFSLFQPVDKFLVKNFIQQRKNDKSSKFCL